METPVMRHLIAPTFFLGLIYRIWFMSACLFEAGNQSQTNWLWPPNRTLDAKVQALSHKTIILITCQHIILS
jgi:hypothetical protein